MVNCPRRYLFMLCSFPLQVTAFGSKFDSLKGGYGSKTTHSAFANDDEREQEHNSRRRNLPQHEDLYKRSDYDLLQSSLFHSEKFLVDSTMFGIANPFDIFPTSNDDDDDDDYNILDFCNGDDCDECSIPEEYKHVENAIDVLVYFGIQRVKPIVAGNDT